MWAFDSRRHQVKAHNVNDDIEIHIGGCVRWYPVTERGEAEG
jgi:hypothetical protein